jgi:hypothetical protein
VFPAEHTRRLHEHPEKPQVRRDLDEKPRVAPEPLAAEPIDLLDAAFGVLPVPAHVPLADRTVRARHRVRVTDGHSDEVSRRKPGLCRCLKHPAGDSWPSTNRSRPGGAQPYAPKVISRSVPHTPTAIVWTSTGPSAASGSEMSSTQAEPAFRGATVSARISPPSTLGGQMFQQRPYRRQKTAVRNRLGRRDSGQMSCKLRDAHNLLPLRECNYLRRFGDGERSRERMSAGNLRKCSEVFASAMEHAVREGMSDRAPTRSAAKALVVKQPITVFTDEKMTRVLDAAAKNRLEVLYLLPW